MNDNLHQSVLLEETIAGLRIRPGDTVVDATLGGAGHFTAMLRALEGNGTLIGIDADEEAITRAQNLTAHAPGVSVHLVRDNFRNLAGILDMLGVTSVDKVLFDLGWSAYHLESGRGFSFRAHEPLVMTYGRDSEHTAADVVNSLPEEELAELLFTLGEERFARSIARGIVRARKEKRILTTDDVVAVVESSVPGWYTHRRIHPATKTFQALRMYVNDELGALREGLAGALETLSPCGRIAVITFHSIEDRVVKHAFKDAAHAGQGTLVTKKPITPSAIEVRENPRSRSAKLRLFERAPFAAVVSDVPSYLYA